MGPIGYPETSVINYHYSLRDNPEDRSSHLFSDGTLKSRISDCPSRDRESKFLKFHSETRDRLSGPQFL